MTSLRPRLLILSEYFEPSTTATAQLSTDLAIAFANLSFEVIVLTSTAGSSHSNLEVVRLNKTATSSLLISLKAISGILFLLKSFLWSLRNCYRYDQVFIYSNPPFAGVVGLLLTFFCRKPYVFVLQDLFPRSASLTGILPSKGPILSLWKLLISLVIANSRSTVVLSESMRSRATSEYMCSSKYEVIPNWSVQPPHQINKRAATLTYEWELDNSLVVQYSGNFGRLHDIITVLEAARLTQHYPIKYLFIGDGAKRAYLDKYTQSFEMSNVILKPFQPRSSLMESLAVADLSLVTLIPGATDTVAPSKLYGILASGRPVLFVGNSNSEIAQFISTNRCGFVFDIGDVEGLVSCLLELLTNKTLISAAAKCAYSAYVNNYGVSKSSAMYVSLLKNA